MDPILPHIGGVHEIGAGPERLSDGDRSAILSVALLDDRAETFQCSALSRITIDVAWLPALTPPRHGRLLGSAILDRASAAAIGSVDRVSAR